MPLASVTLAVKVTNSSSSALPTNGAATTQLRTVRTASVPSSRRMTSLPATLKTRATFTFALAPAAPDGTLIINVGSDAGLKVGTVLAVKRMGRKITDPATGRVLRQVEDAIGQMTVTEVDAKSAVGKFSGTGKPQVGDAVKNQ